MSSSSIATPELHEPTGSPWPHYALMGLHILLLSGPRFRYRRAVAGLGTAVLMALCWRHPNFTSDIGVAQPFSMAWSTYLATLEKMVLLPSGQDTETCFWRVDMPQREASGYAAYGFQKIRWALVLIFNMRGIRWNYQVKNVRPTPHVGSRGRFLMRRLVAAVYYVAMADLASQAMLSVFYTNEQTLVRGDVDSTSLPIWDDRSVAWSFIKTLTFAVQPYYMLQMQYTIMSIIAVASHLSKPADWPPQFGVLSETTSLRDFWGSYWHQTLRRLFQAWTCAFRDACNMKPGSWMSRYSQLWLSFLMSGLGHTASTLILPSPKALTLQDRTLGLVVFFMWQAFAITMEDGVKHIWTHWIGGPTARQSPLVRWVGYMWVIGSLWYSLGWVGDVFVQLRLAEQPILPFSLWETAVVSWVPWIRDTLVVG